MKNTTIQDSNKHNTIHHLRPPESSMEGEASKVVRYQKYAVSEDNSHSLTAVPLAFKGHCAQGNGLC